MQGANKGALAAFGAGTEPSVSTDIPEDEEGAAQVLDCASLDLLHHGETKEAWQEDEKVTTAAACQRF